jgi:hypothetical protein
LKVLAAHFPSLLPWKQSRASKPAGLKQVEAEKIRHDEHSQARKTSTTAPEMFQHCEGPGKSRWPMQTHPTQQATSEHGSNHGWKIDFPVLRQRKPIVANQESWQTQTAGHIAGKEYVAPAAKRLH